MSEPKTQIVLKRRSFFLVMGSLLILIVLLPIGIYWYVQTVATHEQWAYESDDAFMFAIDTSQVANQMRGNFGPWDNGSRFTDGELMLGAQLMLYDLSHLDVSHYSQLNSMAMEIQNFTSRSGAFCGYPNRCGNVTASHLITWSSQLITLSQRIYYAYSVYNNYTQTNRGVAPSIWYTGPSNPDERDLQDAITICANLTR